LNQIVEVASAVGSVLPILGFVFLGKGIPLFTSVFVKMHLGNMSTGMVFAILMAIVIPGLRGTGTAIILTVMHLLGDGLSQPLIGQIFSALQSSGSLFFGFGGRFPILEQMAHHQHLTLALACVAAPSMFLSLCSTCWRYHRGLQLSSFTTMFWKWEPEGAIACV
jgi:hypothetical protein